MGVTIHHDLEYYWKNDTTTTTNAKPKNTSFLEPAEISPGKESTKFLPYTLTQLEFT